MSEKGGNLNPLNPEDWNKAFNESQKSFDAIFESNNQASPEASVDGGENIKKSKTRRGRGGTKKTTSAETKEKIRETSRISKEKAEIKNYIDKILLGINFEPEILNLGQEMIKKLNDLATKSVMELDVENRKEEALRMIGEEINNKLQSLDEDSDDYKVYSKIIETINQSSEKGFKIREIDKLLESERNELSASEGLLDKVSRKSAKAKIEERIASHRNKIEGLEFDRDMLDGQDIESIDDIFGKSVHLKKVDKKNGKATKIDRGKAFEDVLRNKNLKKGDQILTNTLSTSNVKNIKKCVDGSYIIETTTSYYRLKIEGENIETKDDLGAEENPEEESVKENAETDIESEDDVEENLYTQESYDKLKDAGADDEDIKYFFNLKKAERDDLLSSDEEDLKNGIEKLKASRIENDEKEASLAQDDVSDKFNKVGASQEDIDYFYGNLTKEERLEAFNLDDIGFEDKILELKEERLKNEDGFVDNFSPEEIAERFEKIGIIEDEKRYFFNLGLEDRLDFLNSTDEELKLRIEKLREDGIKSANERIIPLTQELDIARQDYLKKEDEIGMTVSRLKNFFKNLIVDDKYEIEKELEEYKERYEAALKNYTEAIVDIEGLNDREEREILFRYAKFGETLNLMDAKETIKFQKHPFYESIKRDLGVGTLSLVDKYKDLLGKSRKFITEKTGSKVLGIGGGAIAVGGAMSLLAGAVPGLRGVARVMGIAVATKGFYEKAETEAFIEKEKDTKKDFIDIEGRYVYMDGLKSKIDEDFKEELNLIIKNIPESAMQEREQEIRRVLSSFGKAVLVNLAFYEAGKALKDSGAIEEGLALIKEYLPTEKIASFIGIASSSDGAKVHSGPSYPPATNESPMGSGEIESLGEPREINPIENQTVSEEVKNNPVKIEADKASTGDNGTSKPENVVEENIQNKFEGIDVNDLNRGEIALANGKGIKDSVASLLAQNSEKLTEGKMGWDPNKYKSVQEWADKRAVGIVAELKEKYPKYNFDKVSAQSKIEVDLSNEADIKIVGFQDPKHLGGNQNLIKDLGGKTIKEAPLNNNENISKEKIAPEIRKEIPQVDIEKDVLKMEVEINRANTLKEVSVANILGFKPAEYAELNDISLKRLFGELKDSPNSVSPNVKLKNLFTFMMENNQIDDMDKTVSETIRGLSEESLQKMTIGYETIPSAEYNTFINGLMRGEFELGMSEKGARSVFVNLDKIRNETIGNGSDNAIFRSFKEAVEKTGIKFAYSDGESVKSYVMKTMIKAYEEGTIGKFREELKIINENIKN